jgi:hypothetical protein
MSKNNRLFLFVLISFYLLQISYCQEEEEEEDEVVVVEDDTVMEEDE